MELEESKPPPEAAGAEVQGDDKAACAEMESAPAVLPDAIATSAAPAPEPSAGTQGVPQEGRKKENANTRENPARYKAPLPSRHSDQTPPKSYLCHYELAESLPPDKVGEWVPCPVLGSALPFKELRTHPFLSAEQLRAPFPLPEPALLFPDPPDKFKELPSDAFQQLPQVAKLKLAFGPPCSALPPPLRSASVTTIQHTVLQQHGAALKVLQPPQQLVSQVPALCRAPLAQLGLCPAALLPPPLPLLPPSALPPAPLAFPALPPFPSLLAPAVIPLQPLF